MEKDAGGGDGGGGERLSHDEKTVTFENGNYFVCKKMRELMNM